jgi:hypothetical protein
MFIKRRIRQQFPRARLALIFFCSMLALAGMLLLILSRW